MNYNLEYKVPGGKLLRMHIKSEKNTILQIRIAGDFFMHPEESITLIESALIGTPLNQVGQVLKDFIKNNNIKIIGFDIKDIEKMLSNIEQKSVLH